MLRACGQEPVDLHSTVAPGTPTRACLSLMFFFRIFAVLNSQEYSILSVSAQESGV